MKHPEMAIYELLKHLSSGRVTALRAPQNSKAPFIIYQRTDSERWRSVNGPSGMAQATVQVDVYADEYAACKQLAGEVEDVLDGYRGFVAYGADSPQMQIRIAGISLQSDSDLLDQEEEPFLYRNIAQYLITYEQ